jgi:hypothetical protein
MMMMWMAFASPVQALVVVFAMLVSDKMTCFFLVSKASSSLFH